MSELRERVREACRAWNLADTLGEHIDAGEAMHDLLVRGVLTDAEPDGERIEGYVVSKDSVGQFIFSPGATYGLRRGILILPTDTGESE